jgi:hypothetical protein
VAASRPRSPAPPPRRGRTAPAAGAPAAPPGPDDGVDGRDAGGDDADERPGQTPRLDGRRAHVLDRAATYVALADQGLTAAQIARRRASPRGTSRSCSGSAAPSATCRPTSARHSGTPRITWRLVQGLVRSDVDPASLRRQLRAAVGGFSTHNVDRRRRARGAPAAATAVAPGVAWGWDAAWFARDPAGYAAAHLAHLTHLHRVIEERARRAVAARVGAAVDGGQSLRALQRRLAHLTATGAAGTGDGAASTRRSGLRSRRWRRSGGRSRPRASAGRAAIPPRGPAPHSRPRALPRTSRRTSRRTSPTTRRWARRPGPRRAPPPGPGPAGGA